MPKLVVFKDTSLVSIVPLEKEVLFIGRKSSNDVPLSHSSVSRQHAKLSCRDGTWSITDLDSTNGIEVNGNKVTRSQLTDGDKLTVGDFTLIFHQETKGLVLSESVKRSPLLQEDLLTTQAVAPQGDFSSVVDAYEALRALFLLVNRFSGIAHSVELLEQMIACLMEIFGAERGSILLYTSRRGKLDVAIARGFDPVQAAEAVSRTIALAVVKERQPVLITDVEAEKQYHHVESIQRSHIRSILCAPIVKKQKTIGAVYLDSKVVTRVFSSRDLSFLDAFCTHAADVIERATERDRVESEARNLRTIQKGEDQRHHDFESVVGQSAAMEAVLGQVSDVAAEDVTVLLLGESGTGKELLAKSIHYASPRAGKPFVAVNCMALSEDIIESELFGHEKGAFSGAVERRLGRFELADGGTLFLDEIGELSSRVQVKLLRALQERQIDRVGGDRPVEVDIRIVCATNADLERAVKEGRFREDLYYRIHVFPIRIPPLRDRRGDIPALIEFYIRRFNARMRRKHSGIDQEALDHLMAYDWPGNVRELVNVLERAFILEKGDRLTLGAFPLK